LREVDLAPFFLSKFELTQAQWSRLTGSNPSEFRYSGLHPVDKVSWNDCALWLPRVGLTLPPRDHWEYAARAGSSKRWTCGDDEHELALFANVLDQTAPRTAGVDPNADLEPWTDGYGHTAPVGTFRPNAFGLHDCHGNLLEWVLEHRITVGGSWVQPAASARCTSHGTSTPDSRSQVQGVRPAMLLP